MANFAFADTRSGNEYFSLRWLPNVYSKVEKCKFQPQKVPMDISEKNKTKVMHRITFRASNTVNGIHFSAVAITTVTF